MVIAEFYSPFSGIVSSTTPDYAEPLTAAYEPPIPPVRRGVPPQTPAAPQALVEYEVPALSASAVRPASYAEPTSEPYQQGSVASRLYAVPGPRPIREACVNQGYSPVDASTMVRGCSRVCVCVFACVRLTVHPVIRTRGTNHRHPLSSPDSWTGSR